LLAGNKFFKMTLDIMIIGSMEKFLKVNPVMIKTLGYSEEELLNGTFFTYIVPEDHEISQKELDKLSTGAVTVQFENRWICKDGSIKWISWSVSPDIVSGLIYAIGRDVSSQKEKEQALKTANSFFEISFDAFFVAKGEKIIKINPAFTFISGYSPEDLEKITFQGIIEPAYVKIVNDRITELLQGKDRGSGISLPIICKDGSIKWVDMMMSPEPETELIYVVLEDITQNRIDQEKLDISNKKLKEDDQQIEAIFNGAPDAVIVIDAQSKILRWNPKAAAIFGWEAIEIIGKPIYETIIPGSYREQHKKGMENFLTTGAGPILNKTIEITALTKQGTEFPISLSISPIKMGTNDFFIGFVRDITEIKKANEELSLNEEKLNLILQNIDEGIVVADADKKIVLTNGMANELYGVEENDKISPSLANHFQIFYPDGKTTFPAQNLPMERALNGEESNNIELILWNPAVNTKRRVLVSGKPLIDQNNKMVVALVTIKDISKYKELEAELKETESNYRKLIGYTKNEHKGI